MSGPPGSGHPLTLEEDSEDIRELLADQPEPEDDFADDCAAACVAALYQDDLLAALCDSDAGQRTLHSSTHRWLAAHQLNTARSWGGWAFATATTRNPQPRPRSSSPRRTIARRARRSRRRQ